MDKQQDIRWEQRFENYQKALLKLTEAMEIIEGELKKKKIDLSQDNQVNQAIDSIIKEGLIQRFEYTFELAWNVMKDYAFYQGNTDISGSRDAIRYAYSANLVQQGEIWMEMIQSRIKTTHTYHEETANDIFLKILHSYYPAFMKLDQVMKNKQLSN